jgi:DNA uptake protein ComE-like DNA-binding protein
MHATRSTPAAPLDINTASVTQLAALPGMGWEYAQRVIASRPYHAKNQLSQLGILPDAEYQRIKDLIVAHRVHAPETRRQGAATAACGGAKK